MAKFNVHAFLLSNDEKIKLLEDFASLFSFGDVPQTVADDFMEHGNSIEKKIGQSIDASLAAGSSFTDGIADWFPPIAVEAIRVGSEAGELAIGCENAKKAMEATKLSIANFINGIKGPLLSVIVTIGVISVAGGKIMPIAAGRTPVQKWPLVSRIVFDLGANVTTYWFMYAVLMCLTPLVIWVLLTSWTGYGRETANDWPIFRQYNLITGIQVLNGLSQLCQIGRSLDESVDIINATANEYTASHLIKIKERIQESQAKGNLGILLDTGLFEPRIIGRLRRITNASFEDYFLLNRAAQETSKIYVSNVNRVTAITTYISKFVAYGMGLMMFAAFFLMVLPQINNMAF